MHDARIRTRLVYGLSVRVAGCCIVVRNLKMFPASLKILLFNCFVFFFSFKNRISF